MAAALLLFPRVAQAAPPELDAPGIEGCPSPAELRSGITRQLGRDDFDASNAPRVSVRIRRQGETLVADVTLVTLTATPSPRTIDGGAGTCAELVRAAALTVALALEAEALPTPPKPAPAPPPPPLPVEAAAPPPAESASSSPARDLRSDRAVVLASAISTVGLLPRAATGGAASARVRVTEMVWLSARGLFLPEARMSNDTFGMTLAAGGLGACLEPFGSRSVTAVGCAHVIGGSLAVVGAGVPMRDSGSKAFGAALVSAGVRARVIGPLAVEGAVEAAVPFAHPTFVTDVCPATGFQQPFAALAVLLGAGVSIP